MVTNILSLLLLIGLVVLFGWLTYRAVRAKRMWVKIVGGLIAGIFALLWAVISFYGIKGLAIAYIPPAPAPDLTVAGTPEQIARGEYIVNVSCVGCHGADGEGELPLTGGLDFSEEIPIPIGQMIAANLTPGGVAGERSDGELFRAIRHGYGSTGALAMMSFMPYRELSDADTEAIIAYLRTQEPVTTIEPRGDRMNLLGVIMFLGAEIIPLPETPDGVIQAPPEGPTAEYGSYVATFGECKGCHGPNMTGAEATAVTEAVPNPRFLVSELSQAQFVEMMRSGVRPGNNPFPETMPWQNAARMTDSDLAALYAYLTTEP
jgi:mono/diheme cytochrome c family protein